MKTVLFFIFFTAFAFTCIANGQEFANKEVSNVSIPSNIKQEIVRRILIYKFKPSKNRRVIYVAEKGISREWLPAITNIEFRLLSDEEVEDTEKKIYFFTELEQSSSSYTINLGFGDPDCNYSGDGWRFRINKGKIRLWYEGEIGGGCIKSYGANFQNPGKLNTYPNELKNYRFFNKGKLEGLKLTISTKEDVTKNFGSDCESECDYDEDWKIHINYFGSMHKKVTVENKEVKYVPKEEYLGKIYSIGLRPKKPVSFSNIKFPIKFSESFGSAIGHNYGIGGGKFGAVHISHKNYIDRYGLEYTIFEKIDYTVGEIEKNNSRKGDLTAIRYEIPDKIEEAMFVEEK